MRAGGVLASAGAADAPSSRAAASRDKSARARGAASGVNNASNNMARGIGGIVGGVMGGGGMGPMGGAGMGLQVGGQPSPPMPLHGGGIMGGMEGVLLDGMAVRACTWPCPRRALAACAAT